uniref:N/A n=1 Tax=Ganoderma boninense TaxID=34458 RepID=A0A5K1JSM7_9APHY|nr:N/A [Ganoderma boninense]
MSSNSQLTAKNKRRNATLSCAECRRLKLRFVLANTEVLHDKITILANRVRALEDALEDAHSNLSGEIHPLLSDELRALKRPLERESPEEQVQEQEQEVIESINVGSLSISESGHTQFFGGMANAWYLLQQEAGSDDEEHSPQMQLPTEIPWLSHTFPFYTAPNEIVTGIRETVLASLPDQIKARELVTIYYRHAAWMYTPIPEAEFEDTIFSRIYDQRMETEPAPKDSHRLAVFCLVLALGALLDLDRPTLSADASQYYQLGRAVLSLDSILESQSIPAIQALILMCHYMFLSFVEGPRWALMGLAVKLAQSLGLRKNIFHVFPPGILLNAQFTTLLDRDSGKWNLDPRETFRRRSLFYELYTYDSWQSLTYGRPPSFAMSFVDCQIPEESTKNDQGECEMSFAAWKHRFSSKCLSIVHEQAFGAKVPRYHAISELDKRVRDFYIPPSLRVPGFGGASMEGPHVHPPVELTMQRYIAFAIKEISLFYLHRGFFAKALEDHPSDPLGSKYAPSVLAAYNSACSFVGLIRSLYSQHPGLTERMWFLFTHVFSCSIVLGSIATKCPSMALAPSALSNLDSALNLFEQVSQNARAAKVLPVLRKLKARALAAKQSLNTGPISASSSQSSMDNPLVKEEDDELAALGGKTRLISRRSPGSNSQPSSPQPSSTHSMSPIDQPTAAPYMTPETPPSAAESTSSIQAENTNTNGPVVTFPRQICTAMHIPLKK